MASKCCSYCAYTLPLSTFLTDPSNPGSKSLSTCIKCHDRDKTRKKKKRKSLVLLDPNIPSKRPATNCTKSTNTPLIPPPYIQPQIRPESSIRPLPLPESRPQAPLIPPPIPESHPLPPPPPPPLPPPP